VGLECGGGRRRAGDSRELGPRGLPGPPPLPPPPRRRRRRRRGRRRRPPRAGVARSHAKSRDSRGHAREALSPRAALPAKLKASRRAGPVGSLGIKLREPHEILIGRAADQSTVDPPSHAHSHTRARARTHPHREPLRAEFQAGWPRMGERMAGSSET
jgi:hypothetical protein